MSQFLDNLSPFTMVAFSLLFTVVVAVFAFMVSTRRMQAVRESWQSLSMRTGLSYQPGSFLVMPSLTGEFRRRPLTLNTYTRSTGKSSVTYTRVIVGLKSPAAGTLALSPEGFLSGLGKALGMQDVQVGSERFDKSFMVKGNPPEFATGVLGDPNLQDALARVRESHTFNLELSGQSITYTEVGLLRDTDFLESLFNTLNDLADKVDGGAKSGMFSS